MNRTQVENAASWRCSTRDEQWVDKGTLSSAPSVQGADLRITVLEDNTCQDIIGWGACFNELGWLTMGVLSEEERTAVLASLFSDDGCRFGYCRMSIGANDYVQAYYSLNDHPGDFAMEHFSIERDRQFLIPYIKAAMSLRPELKLWGSPWTPPAWMKTNNLFWSGELTWTPENLAAYALYFAKFVNAYRAEGINVVAVHPQNEPLFPGMHPTCWWEGWQLRDFLRDHLGPRFQKDGIDCEIWLGTINGEAKYDVWGNWVEPVLSDPGANQFITGCGFQWYGNVAAMPMKQKFPDKRMMQTETMCGSGTNDWAYAEETFFWMRWYFERGANAYMQWNMMLDETGLNTTGWKQSAMITIDRKEKKVVYNPQYFTVRHFSQYVSPGAHRVVSGGTYPEHVAFRNPDGEVIIVAANTSDGPLTVTFEVGERSAVAELPPHSFNTVRFPANAE